jgi:drug/metabolite transporter (DMT)-like permease
MNRNNPALTGALFGLLAFALFSTHDVVVKQLGATYSPVQIVFFSGLLSFPLAILLAVRDGTPGTLRPVHPYWMALRSVTGMIASLSAFFAFTILPLAQVYAIIFATPLFITVLSIPLLGERVRFRRWAAVIVGLFGVMIVLRPGAVDLGIGHLAALTCAVGGATNSIVVRKIGRDERGVVLVLFPMLLNFVVMGAALPWVYQPMPIQDLGLQAMTAVMSFLAMLSLIMAYKSAEAVIVAPMQYSQIIWATVFGILFFAEWPDAWTMCGALVIISSGVYILLRESRPDASDNQPVSRTRSRVGMANGLRVGPLLPSRRADDPSSH